MSIKRQKPEADTLTVLRDHTFVTIRKTHNSKSSPELPLTNFLRSPWAISHRQATKLRTVWEKHHPGGTRRAGWPPGAEILGGEGPHPRVAAAGAPPAPPENPWPPPPLAAVPQHGEHLPPSSLSPAARCPERCPHPAMAVRGGSTHCTAPSASGAGAVRGQRESERASEVRPSVRPPVLPTCLPSCRPLLPGRLASSCSASSFSRVPLPGYEHPSGGGVEAAASHRPVHARPAKDAPPGGRPPPPVASVSPAAALSRQSRPYVARVTGGRGAGRKGEVCVWQRVSQLSSAVLFWSLATGPVRFLVGRAFPWPGQLGFVLSPLLPLVAWRSQPLGGAPPACPGVWAGFCAPVCRTCVWNLLVWKSNW